jgi:hypothetical protein
MDEQTTIRPSALRSMIDERIGDFAFSESRPVSRMA